MTIVSTHQSGQELENEDQLAATPTPLGCDPHPREEIKRGW